MNFSSSASLRGGGFSPHSVAIDAILPMPPGSAKSIWYDGSETSDTGEAVWRISSSRFGARYPAGRPEFNCATPKSLAPYFFASGAMSERLHTSPKENDSMPS